MDAVSNLLNAFLNSKGCRSGLNPGILFALLITGTLFLSCAPGRQLIQSDHVTETPQLTPDSVVPEFLTDGCFDFSRLSSEDQVFADSLLYQSLNNTGLHTFVSDLKPMSDITAFRWQVVPTETDENPSLHFVDDYIRLNRITEAISCGPVKTILTPFRNIFDGERYVQMRVVRSDAVDRVLAAYPEFWARWAFAPGSNPAIVVQVMEYEERFDRFRGYGYLYGYPAHAVDFFVEAAMHQAETGEFVARDFMQMPVVSGRTGMFVYAVKEGHEKNVADLRIEQKALENIAFFKVNAQQWYREDGSFDASGFLRAVFTEMGWVTAF